MKKLKIYAVFHLNLAFSSIEEERRHEVIDRCYWPLLRLAEQRRLPLGIEATGYTLEVLAALDRSWIQELRRLCESGTIEFIGSGYAQLIGPLVPAEINRRNQALGLGVYQRMLGLRPYTALVCEQAYSSGMVLHYLDAGYKAIIMDWDNPKSHHKGWEPEWGYLPQYACGPDSERIPVIWAKSVPFQKFQRYAHGEMEIEEYLGYLESHLAENPRAFSIYSNDTEIFDFRPERYETEDLIGEESEWRRIGRLFDVLSGDERFQIILPGQVLALLSEPRAGRVLELQSPGHPIPVKKQAKYNVLRWALTGRDDLRINTECWRLYERLRKERCNDESEWKELCYLWSSDFRTHITKKRWAGFNQHLKSAMKRHRLIRIPTKHEVKSIPAWPSAFKVVRRKHCIEVANSALHIRLNTRRGLAIDEVTPVRKPGPPVLVTLPHGHFDDISLAADFYTGHLVLEIPGEPKVTDLEPTCPEIGLLGEDLIVGGRIETSLGPIIKQVKIPPERTEFSLQYEVPWGRLPAGALRLGHITLNPQAFDVASLFFRTHNGGFEPETFLIGNEPINHLAPVMPLISATQGLGITEGTVEVGDRKKTVRVEIDRCAAALTGHIVYQPCGNSYLFRLVFSASEVDDTCRKSDQQSIFSENPIRFRVILSI